MKVPIGPVDGWTDRELLAYLEGTYGVDGRSVHDEAVRRWRSELERDGRCNPKPQKPPREEVCLDCGWSFVPDPVKRHYCPDVG